MLHPHSFCDPETVEVEVEQLWEENWDKLNCRDVLAGTFPTDVEQLYKLTTGT